jgi:hypothetical protein
VKLSPIIAKPTYSTPMKNLRATRTSQKMDINTGSRGPFVPEIIPVQKIRDKSPPPFGTGSLQTGIKGASTLAPRRVQG